MTPDLSADRHAALQELTASLRGTAVTGIRLNTNRSTLLSLRGDGAGGMRLSLHQELLDHPAAMAEIPLWIRGRGRQCGPQIRAAITTIFGAHATKRRERLRQDCPELPALGGPADLVAIADRIHASHFPTLSKPDVLWGRGRRSQPKRRIRFGAYFRRTSANPRPRIVINPALDQPWIATEFLAFVVYHEFCHHAMASDPIRGEPPHSARFRALEARYPGMREILLWEKANLDRFLGGPAPS